MSAQSEKVLSGKRIGLFGKGGSGKSTLSVLLAKALVRVGYDVCLLDADSTNIGLSMALGVDHDPVPLLDYYGGMVFSGGLVTCPVDDPTPLEGAHVSTAELPDAYHGNTPDGIHFFVAGKMGDKGPGAGCDGPIAKISRDFRPEYANESPVTLVDFKAGFEDSARGNIISLDWILVVIDPTSASIQMAINMRDMVDQLEAGGLPATAHLDQPDLVEMVNRLYREARVKDVLFALNKVQEEETDLYLRQELEKYGIVPTSTIYDDPLLSMAWLKGTPLSDVVTRPEVNKIIEALEIAEKRMITRS